MIDYVGCGTDQSLARWRAADAPDLAVVRTVAMYRVYADMTCAGMATTVAAPREVLNLGTGHGEAMMTNVDPARFANEQQAMHPQASHPHFGEYDGPPPRKRKPIRNLIRRILGRDEKKDQ